MGEGVESYQQLRGQVRQGGDMSSQQKAHTALEHHLKIKVQISRKSDDSPENIKTWLDNESSQIVPNDIWKSNAMSTLPEHFKGRNSVDLADPKETVFRYCNYH